MSILSNLLLVTLVVCLSAKYVSSIDCYVCDPSDEASEGSRSADPDDTDTGSSDEDTDDTEGGGCNKVNKGMIRRCADDDDVCSILMIENSDRVVQMSRHCGITDDNVKRRWEEYGETEGESDTSEGLTASWMVCEEDLCNWGVTNKSQMITLFVSVMLSLSVYYPFV